MNILIIGGTTFIGPVVVRQLVAMQHQVTIFHRGHTPANVPASVNHILGDRHSLLNYRSEFEQLALDVVLDMIPYTQLDAQGVIETFKGIAHRAVGISSQDVYRAHDILWGREVGMLDPTPLSEDSPLRSQLYPYQNVPHPPIEIPSDYDKILVEQIYTTAPEPIGTILRLPMVYGGNDPLHRFFPYLKRMDEGRPAIVLEEQMAHWQGSYGYVENVAHAIVLAVTDPTAHRIYNIAEPAPLSQANFIRAIGQAAGWTGRVIVVPQSALPESWVLPFNVSQNWVTDSTRIRQELAYTEPIPREDAFKRTVEWQRLHPPQTGSLDAPELLDYATEDKILEAMVRS